MQSNAIYHLPASCDIPTQHPTTSIITQTATESAHLIYLNRNRNKDLSSGRGINLIHFSCKRVQMNASPSAGDLNNKIDFIMRFDRFK